MLSDASAWIMKQAKHCKISQGQYFGIPKPKYIKLIQEVGSDDPVTAESST